MACTTGGGAVPASGAQAAVATPASTDLPAGVHREMLDHPVEAGKKVEMFWIAPAELDEAAPDRRLPAVLLVHGHQFGERPGARFYVDRGTLAATTRDGYFAAAVSQPGYGASDGPPDFCGPRSQQAVAAALAALRADPRIDPDRIALMGYSRGAIVASMVASRDGRLAAVVLGAGEYDFVRSYHQLDEGDETQAGIKHNIEHEAGTSVEAFEARSALYADPPIRVPTIILHGENDARIGAAGARALAERLREAGTEVELVIVPGAGHSIPREAWHAAVDPFLARRLAPAGGSEPGE